ncbi:MAG: DUF2919 family protein [Rhodospirillales bacterium]|nr:DUF2919 family protein [Rhodospirillales bacterium]
MDNAPYKYHFLRYNQFQVLRPSLALKLILCFLCKDFFLGFIIGAITLKSRGTGSGLSELMDLIRPIFFFSSVPAVAVLYAISARTPEAGRLPRFLWKNGQYLILASVLMYLAILGYIRGFDLSNLTSTDWAVVAVNLALVAYVFFSEAINDTFAEFPMPRQAAENSKMEKQ